MSSHENSTASPAEDLHVAERAAVPEPVRAALQRLATALDALEALQPQYDRVAEARDLEATTAYEAATWIPAVAEAEAAEEQLRDALAVAGLAGVVSRGWLYLDLMGTWHTADYDPQKFVVADVGRIAWE